MRATRAGLLALAVVACSHDRSAESPRADLAPSTPAEKLLAMLPPNAQVVIELDLARLRANAVVGSVVSQALAVHAADDQPAPDRKGLALSVPASPLAGADHVVLAAYGVGTAQAATVTLLAAPHDLEGTTRLADGFYALGPPEWIEQVQQRVTLASTGDAKFAIRAAPELLALRDHAMPAGAPGASLRITARLSFDARVALARQTGLDSAPAQLSAWGDVVDDLALIIDCDAADPGNAAKSGKPSDAPKRLEATLRGALAGVADQPAIKLLGLPSSLSNARFVTHGSWVRAIVAVGPSHLARVVERAGSLLKLAAPADPAAPSEPPAPTHGAHAS
ncbi:MAG TPA: hypothetical protein VGC42_27455 [Kofleriaceae bacterium]